MAGTSKENSNPKIIPISDTTYADAIKEAQQRTMGIPGKAIREINAFNSSSFVTDPVAVGFKIFFNYNSYYGLLGKETDNHDSNSAIDYLYRIGQDARASLLKKFISHLQDINMNLSFMFQEIDGLDTIRQHKPWERYKEEDSIIKINMLETIDFKVQALMSMYNNIWYDSIRGVEVLPANLRRFDCSIFIYAIGAYQIHLGATSSSGEYLSSSPQVDEQLNQRLVQVVPNILKNYGENQKSELVITNTNGLYVKSPDLFNHVVYDLSECEFLPWEAQEGFHKPSNKETTYIDNNIAFSFRWCTPGYRFFDITADLRVSDNLLFAVAVAGSDKEAQSLLDKYNTWKSKAFGDSWLGNVAEGMFDKAVGGLVSTASDLYSRYGSVDKLKSLGKTILQQSVESVADRLGNYAAAKINSLYLGNVYDYTSAAAITGALNGGTNVVGGLSNALLGKSSASLNSTKKLASPGPNVYTKM